MSRIVGVLRVLLVSDWFPEHPGDLAGTFVRAQALAVARDHEVVVVHLRTGRAGEGRPHLEERSDGPLRILRARLGTPRPPRTAVNLWAVGAALRRLRRDRIEPEILHAHEFGAGFAALVHARRLRRPVVISEHHSGFALGEVRGVSRSIARIAFAGADVVCPVSESLRSSLEASGYSGRFRVVPNVVDTELFTPGAVVAAGPRPRIVSVAALVPVKGIADLIEAAGLLAGRGVGFRLDVVGDGPERRQLEARVLALELGEHVVFHGARAPAAVAGLMRDAAFVVVPSLWETFSVVLSEAMACGLPVVATNVGGLLDRVHERNGIVCPAGDPADLAAAIERMIDAHPRYDRAAIAADARERLSPAAVAARWSEIYSGAVAAGRRSRRMS